MQVQEFIFILDKGVAKLPSPDKPLCQFLSKLNLG